VASADPGLLPYSRREPAGSDSARGLLFTVLGEFVLPAGQPAWTAAFIDVLGRLGVEEKTVRQALMRTAAGGWLRANRTGRRTCWQLTPSAERLLSDGAARIYGFTAARQDWDGRWLLVLARAPETDRAARHRLRTGMIRAGFGSPAPGVWISPDSGCGAQAAGVLGEAGLLADSQFFVAAAGGGDLAAMARMAWDLAEIERRYEEFIGQFSSPAAADPLAAVVGLVHAWRRFPWIDPVLPAELLPEGWSGARAAALFEARHADWSAAARAAWRLLDPGESAADPG
jgi:phenylacetic acid degradation operon negative regulatory protein